MNRSIILMITATCIISSVGIAFVLSVSKPNQQNAKVSVQAAISVPTLLPTIQPTSTTAPTPTSVPKPTIVQSSANQLYVAAYLMGRASADEIAGFKSRHGLPDSTSDTNLIAFLAHLYTTDSARYAQAQATVDQLKTASTNSMHCTSVDLGGVFSTQCN